MVIQGSGGWKGGSQKAPKKTTPSNNNQSSNRSVPHTIDDYQPQPQSDLYGQSGGGIPTYSDSAGKPIPEYSGRPPRHGISLSEMFFPWHTLKSFTTALLIINLCYFIAILIYAGVSYPPAFSSTNKMGGPTAIALQRMGAKWTPSIVNGHIYRLFAPIFMHAGILHLAYNSYFLARYGWLTEERFGRLIMLGIYIFSGIGSTAASALITPKTVSCGASGALFGLLGANLYFVIRHYRQLRNAMCELIMIIFILVINLLLGFLQPGSTTDNWAHLFGFVYGVLASIPVIHWFRDDINKKREKKLQIAGAVISVVSWILMIGLIWIRK